MCEINFVILQALWEEIIATKQNLEGLESEFKSFGSVTKQQILAAGESVKEFGGKIVVTGFVRYEKGEGIQKKEDDFASEVASMIK